MGDEILEQEHALTGGEPDAFVAGVGTGGTLTGMRRRLRAANPGMHIAVIILEIFPCIQGLKLLEHPGDIGSAILDESLIDERLPLALEDAVARSRELARQGLFVRPSSGAFVHRALALVTRKCWRTAVTVLSDTGERYTSTGMWERARVRNARCGRLDAHRGNKLIQNPSTLRVSSCLLQLMSCIYRWPLNT